MAFYVVFLKYFLIVSYFINSSFKKKSVQKLAQVSVKLSKSAIFLYR